MFLFISIQSTIFFFVVAREQTFLLEKTIHKKDSSCFLNIEPIFKQIIREILQCKLMHLILLLSKAMDWNNLVQHIFILNHILYIYP